MTRDAVTQQSVKADKPDSPCKYRHNWEGSEVYGIRCSRCQATPRPRELEEAEAIVRLKEWLKPGDIVYTQLRHVSRSGMMRVIDIRGIDMRNDGPYVTSLGWNVAKAIGYTYDRQREGVKVTGCGMDMGFHVVYTLSYVLFPDGFECVGERCQASAHFNEPRSKRGAGVWHPNHEGAYALRHKWL